MRKVQIITLLVDDNDVDCKTPDGLSKMTLENLNFIPSDLDRYDLIVYQGSRGSKILKSKYTGMGEIKSTE